MSLSLWLDADRGPAREPLDRRVETDVCVVGGGIAGTTQALLLARSGFDVTLLERDRIADHASGRNAGFQITGLGEHYVNAAHSLGRDGARTLWETNRAGAELVRELCDDHGIDAGIERTGSWILAFDDEEMAELKRDHEMLRDDGFDVELLDAGAARDAIGAGFPGALHQPWDGQLNPVKLVAGLADAAEDEGAKIHEDSAAVAVDPSGGGVVVDAEDGAVQAQVAVLATNAYTPLLWPEAAEWLLPARGQMLATEPVDDNPLPGPVYGDHGWVYFRPYRDRFLVGGFRKYSFEEEIGYDEITTDAVQDRIDGFVDETWPSLADVEVTHRWGGTMAMGADGLPMVGPLSGRPELILNIAHTGHGLAYAPMAAKWITDMIATGDNEIPQMMSARRTLDVKNKTPV